MWVKITNCTVTTGGGKTPKRIRNNQNVIASINDNWLDKYTLNEICDMFRYREHNFKKSAGRDFIITNDSKMTKLK